MAAGFRPQRFFAAGSPTGFLRRFPALYIAFSLLAVVATAQAILLGPKTFEGGGGQLYTHYNNFVIYSRAHAHLLEGGNLYISWPEEQYDLYKYSPSFAWAFAPFAALPLPLGLGLWNLFNAIGLLLVWQRLPHFTSPQLAALAWILPIELMTNLQNSQCNALLAAGVLATWIALERRQWFWAAGFAVAGLFLKVYGFAAVGLFLFYPARARLALWSVFWLVVLAALPLLSVPAIELAGQYREWWAQMSAERQVEVGLSFAGVIRAFSGWTPPSTLFTLIAGIIFAAPILRHFRSWKHPDFLAMVLASLLMALVLFNHMAESPTYIVAIAGVALWYGLPWLQGRSNPGWRTALLIGCILLSSLAPTDLYPPVVREQLLKPYAIKALPVCLIWLVLLVEMGRARFSAVAASR